MAQLRVLLRQAGIGLLALSAAGAATAGLSQEERRDMAALKQAAFERVGKLQAAALREAFPERTRLEVYVGVGAEAFQLQHATLSIDGTESAQYGYGRIEAKALRDGALHRILRANLPPGEHRVRVDFRGRLFDSPPDAPPLTGTIELDFEKPPRTKALVLSVEPEALRHNRRLSPRDWQWREETRDPRLGMVDFLRRSGRPFAAMDELMAAAADYPDGGRGLPVFFHGPLAHAYLDFDMRRQAQAALRRHIQAGLDRSLVEDIHLRLAELDYRQGRFQAALRRIDDRRGALTPAQLVVWQDVMSRTLLSLGRDREAGKLLATEENALEVLTEASQDDNQTLLMRYNFAVALLRTGDVAKGRTLLDRIGRMRPFNEKQRALRDRANLALGFHFLEQGQGATAKHIFQRVRMNGPYAAHSLLGLGWSELAPRGTRQQRVPVGDEPEAGTYGIADPQAGRFQRRDQPARYRADAFSQIEFKPFKQAATAEDQQASWRRALVAWRELAGRRSMQAAVQEALVLIPSALYRLGDQRGALDGYRDAVSQLEQNRLRLLEAARLLRSRPMPRALGRFSPNPGHEGGWGWRPAAFPQMNGTAWLADLVTTRRFREVMDHCRDFRLLAQRLNELAPDRAQDDLRERLTRREREELRRLQTIAATELERQARRQEAYLVGARLGMARFYDRPVQVGELALLQPWQPSP